MWERCGDYECSLQSASENNLQAHICRSRQECNLRCLSIGTGRGNSAKYNPGAWRLSVTGWKRRVYWQHRRRPLKIQSRMCSLMREVCHSNSYATWKSFRLEKLEDLKTTGSSVNRVQCILWFRFRRGPSEKDELEIALKTCLMIVLR